MTNSNHASLMFNAFESKCNSLILTSESGEGNQDVKTIRSFLNDRNCLNVFAMTEGVITPAMVESVIPQKALKALIRGIFFVGSDTSHAIAQSYERVTALTCASILLSSDKSIRFDNLRYLIGGRGNEETSSVNGISRSKLAATIGRISNQSTNSAQVSRSIGVNGLWGVLGVTQKDTANSFAVLGKNNPFLLAYAMQLQNLKGDALNLINKV